MRAKAVVTGAVILAFGCGDRPQSPFDEWIDLKTGCIFAGEAPSCDEVASWREVWEAATIAWGAEPEFVRVWIVRRVGQEVFYRRNVVQWPDDKWGMCRWDDGRVTDLYVAAYVFPDDQTILKVLMSHELTHVYWRLPDHGDEWTRRQTEISRTLWEES